MLIEYLNGAFPRVSDGGVTLRWFSRPLYALGLWTDDPQYGRVDVDLDRIAAAERGVVCNKSTVTH